MDDPELRDTVDDELTDTEIGPQDELAKLDLARLANPIVLRALAGIAVAGLVLLWPERTDRILARLIGVALVVVGSTSAWAVLADRARRFTYLAVAAGIIGVGVVLVLFPDRSEVFNARLLSAVLVASVLRDIWLVATGTTPTDARRWVIARSTAIGAVAVVLFAFPSEVFAVATTFAAFGWIIVSVIAIVATVGPDRQVVTSYADSWQLMLSWLDERPKSVDDRYALYEKILYEPPTTMSRVIRFLTLMAFASVIASMGVITDSTAVVIGAMLIAPLMMPLMGMAISLVMGWPRRLARCALIAAAGITLAISVGLLCGLIVPAVIDTETNAQIISRTVPTTLDLIVALAAGAAGAYGLSRPDVSDSLPGVAIAISLVPPLGVVGIAYSQGDWGAGNGALLLFATNMVGILVMGGIVFVITGVTPIRHVAENQQRVRTAVATVMAVAVLVFGALLLNGAEAASNLFRQSSIEDAVDEWLTDFERHQVVRVTQDGDDIVVTIVGPTSGAPDAQSLADALAARLDRSVTADLRLIVEELDTATSGG